MLYTNLTDVRFEEVETGHGSFIWTDANRNGTIDYSERAEFVKAKSGEGNFKKITYSEALGEIEWQFQTAMWLFLAFIMMGVRDVAYMVRIRILTEKKLSWRQSFRVIMMWEFASALTPGVVGGAAVAMFILKKEKISLGKSTAIVMITAMLDNLFYLIMIPTMLIVIGSDQFFPEVGGQEILGISLNIMGVFWAAYGIILVLFGFLLVGVLYKPGWLKRILIGIFSIKFLRKWKSGAIDTGNEIIATSKELKGKPSSYWVRAFLATAFSWTGRFLVVNCIMAAFISTNLMDQLIIYARQLGMWVIMIVSPTPGGSGVAEYAFSSFLEVFIPFGLTGLLAVLWRLISYYPYLFIGTAMLPRWVGSRKKHNS